MQKVALSPGDEATRPVLSAPRPSSVRVKPRALTRYRRIASPRAHALEESGAP